MLRATREGTINLGKGTTNEVRIPCAILEDGRRVLTAAGVASALGQDKQRTLPGGVSQVPRALAASNVKPLLAKELDGVAQVAIVFTPKQGGRIAYGYEPRFMIGACRAILAARRARKGWRSTQEPMAEAAEMLLASFAESGIAAAIDDACGHVARLDEYAEIATAGGAAEAITEIARPRRAPVKRAAKSLTGNVPGRLQFHYRLKEREFIRAALRQHHGHNTMTAAWLGLSRRALYAKVRAHGLEGEAAALRTEAGIMGPRRGALERVG